MKKEQEREELHRAIWAIADELRGAVDGWDFKNYVLGTMFYRYISENLCNYINEGELAAGNVSFDYAQMPDAEAEQAREDLVNEKGGRSLPASGPDRRISSGYRKNNSRKTRVKPIVSCFFQEIITNRG